MTEQITVVRAEDAERYLESDRLVWFEEARDATLEQALLGVPPDQRFAAVFTGGGDEGSTEVDPATYPGVYGVRPMQLGIPGAVIPVAGLTWVGVHPDHRRRGLLTAMMRHHFEQSRHEGVHVSALHASEPAIYGRHGYGLASLELEADLGTGTTLTAPHLEVETVSTRLANVADPDTAARIRAVDLLMAELVPGPIVGHPDYYRMITTELPSELRDHEPGRVLFARSGGRDVGCVPFRRKHKWENARPAASVETGFLRGTPEARLALARRLVALDLAGSVRVRGIAVDDPLLSWVAGPRATGGLQTYDSLWVRLVDLPAALGLRTYAAACDVVVEVTDDSAPWNAGRWRINVADGSATVSPATSSDADLALPISALGAAYLGGGSLAAAARAGIVHELRPGAAVELARAFRTDLEPQPALGF